MVSESTNGHAAAGPSAAPRRLYPGWRSCVHLVRPETVLGWHRKGYRAWWRFKSRKCKPGRPDIGWEVVRLIRRLARENPTWGAHRIANELRKLGHDIGSTTVGRYMRKVRGRGQRWMTFLKNHLGDTVACDFFIVPTIAFQRLYAFVILSHDRRRIVHIGVTAHPTSFWAARQIVEAFPESEPKILLHDRDPLFQDAFARQVAAMGIRELRIRPRHPWMNCYAERVIGSIRRECTDHVIVLNERHLLRVLREYAAYYNEARTHLSLEGDAPISRTREASPATRLRATPVLGGLHHRYTRAA